MEPAAALSTREVHVKPSFVLVLATATLLSLSLNVVLISPALASEKATKMKACKVNTNDVGLIIGRGPSSMDAFEDAATQCFERRSQRFQMKRGTNMDEETGLTVIDACANLTCG